MGKLKDMVTGPYEAGECNEICPGLEHCILDIRLPEFAQAVAYAPSMENAQQVADALNFYHNYAQGAADCADFVQVPERGLPKAKPRPCQCGHPNHPGEHRFYSPCREE